jgi:hypothetical protein
VHSFQSVICWITICTGRGIYIDDVDQLLTMSTCWVLQEVAVKGQDIAFKDVIEPLESVSVSIIKTDKASLEELGSPDEVQPLLYLL